MYTASGRRYAAPHTTPSVRASGALKFTGPCMIRITAEMGFPASHRQLWGLMRLMAVLKTNVLAGQLQQLQLEN